MKIILLLKNRRQKGKVCLICTNFDRCTLILKKKLNKSTHYFEYVEMFYRVKNLGNKYLTFLKM